MIINREEMKRIIIAVCDREFEMLEEIQKEQIFEFTDLDLIDSDMMDLIEYIHRYTAEEYIIRANKNKKYKR